MAFLRVPAVDAITILLATDAGDENRARPWAVAGHRNESFIARAGRAICYGGRHDRAVIECHTAGAQQRLFQIRQMAVEDMTCGRMQVVRLPELRDPAALPCVPRFFGELGTGSPSRSNT